AAAKRPSCLDARSSRAKGGPTRTSPWTEAASSTSSARPTACCAWWRKDSSTRPRRAEQEPVLRRDLRRDRLRPDAVALFAKPQCADRIDRGRRVEPAC